MAKTIHFKNVDDSNFYPTLRKRVNDYFTENNISKNANGAMIFKAVLFVVLLVGTYSLLVFGGITNLLLSYSLWAILGLACTFVTVNICHDAIHGAFTTNKIINLPLRYMFNVLGANEYLWNIMHNVVHHTYTNIPEHDEDIEIVPIIRLSTSREVMEIHRYQHLYSFLLYGFSSLLWVLLKDYRKFFKKRIGNLEVGKHPAKEYFNLFFFKALYYTLFLVLPLVFIPLPWGHVLLGFLVLHLFEGFSLAMIFNLAHTVEETEFPVPDDKGNMENAWAIHQLKTTADFCRNNRVINFLFGGLNYQVEHHLFTKVCHIHYKELSKIVQATAAEYELPYLDQPSFFGAVRSHYNFLKKMGRPAEAS